MCPRCRQNAPLVYRGVSAYCTACGAPRMPLANTSVNLAGQPSKVGGTVARVFGWLVLAGGWSLAALFGGLLFAFGAELAAAIVGGPIALIASVVAYALLRGGRELKKSGDDTEAATKNQAIFALANARNGVLKAWDVAQMLQVTPKEGDDILTRLAKEHPDHVTVDVDDDGNVLYRFPAIHWGGLPQMAPNAHVRVQAPPPQARVAPGSDGSVRVDAREPLDDDLAEAEPARAKAR
ncbi:MAG: hypothetical protein KF850_30775 [Labilithrix sp.]|nr:hypothetical protein [Labilithrix sp.]